MKVPDASMSEFSRGGEIFFAEVTQPSLLVAAITRAPGDDGEIFLLGCEIRRFCSFCCGVGWGGVRGEGGCVCVWGGLALFL